jgi:hypothetical protein
LDGSHRTEIRVLLDSEIRTDEALATRNGALAGGDHVNIIA